MKLEELVCNLELSKRLCELGVKQDSFFYWMETCDNWKVWQPKNKYSNQHSCPDDFTFLKFKMADNEAYSALTASELIEILPAWINDCNLVIKKFPKVYQVKYCNSDNSKILATDLDDSIANALAKIRIHLLENSLITLDAQQ